MMLGIVLMVRRLAARGDGLVSQDAESNGKCADNSGSASRYWSAPRPFLEGQAIGSVRMPGGPFSCRSEIF